MTTENVAEHSSAVKREMETVSFGGLVPSMFALDILTLRTEHDYLPELSTELDEILTCLRCLYGNSSWMDKARFQEVNAFSCTCIQCNENYLDIIEHMRKKHRKTLKDFKKQHKCIICFSIQASVYTLLNHQYICHGLVGLCSLNRLFHINLEQETELIRINIQKFSTYILRNERDFSSDVSTSSRRGKEESTDTDHLPERFFCKKCLLCDLTFDSLLRHLWTKHRKKLDIQQNKCEICGKNLFKGPVAFAAHQLTHRTVVRQFASDATTTKC